MNIGIIGIGKVGSCMLALFTEKGHNVLGYDIISNPLNNVSKTERGLKELVEKYNLKSKVTNLLKTLVNRSEIIFIIVPTPSLPNGRFDIRHVKKALIECSNINRNKIYVVNSTVPPGTIRELSSIVKTLYYNPLFIRLGNVVDNLQNLKFILVGSQNGRAGKLKEFWNTVSNGKIYSSTWETVEVTKIMVNTIMTCNISLINKIGEIYTKSNADYSFLKQLYTEDPLFFLKNFEPGTGYGGPCLPRDSRMIQIYCNDIGVNSNLLKEVENVNYAQINRMISICRPYDRIGIYGIGYKFGSDIIEDSQGWILRNKLLEIGKKVAVYDPCIPELSTVKNEFELGRISDIVVLTLPYKPRIKKYVTLWKIK